MSIMPENVSQRIIGYKSRTRVIITMLFLVLPQFSGRLMGVAQSHQIHRVKWRKDADHMDRHGMRSHNTITLAEEITSSGLDDGQVNQHAESSIHHASTDELSSHGQHNDEIRRWMEKLDTFLSLRGSLNYLTPDQAESLLKIQRLKKRKELQDNGFKRSPMINQHQERKPLESAFQRNIARPNCKEHNKWAVITTIASKVTQTMKALINDRNWCLVVIGDEKTPTKFNELNDPWTVYLSLQDQDQLPFNVIPLTPKNHFSRKNIGYLYAMSQGAEVILDIDDDNEPIPIDDQGTTLPVETSSGPYQRPLLYGEGFFLPVEASDIPVWNPYPLFNLTNAWPRGFPWEYIPFEDEEDRFKTKTQNCKPIIQQYMANWDPDLDAAYRMKFPLPMDYRTSGEFKRLVLPRNVFSPYNAQATVHLPEAFWSMMLPTTVDGRVSDIWRSYIAQSLFHLVPEACLMFTSPAVHHARNPHSYAADFLKEIPLYSTAARVVQLVRNLPIVADRFSEVFSEVYRKLVKTGVVEVEDYHYGEAWQKDLENLRVYQPTIPGRGTWMRNTKLCINFNFGYHAHIFSNELLSKHLPLFQNSLLLLGQATGPEEAHLTSRLDYTEHWPDQVKVQLCNSSKGWFQSRCLLQCLQQADNKNILYMADDDYFDFSMTVHESMPMDKIWFSPMGHVKGTVHSNASSIFNKDDWIHWDDVQRGWNLLIQEIPSHMKEKYIAFINATGEIYGSGMADSAYVPVQYHEKLIEALRTIETLDPQLIFEVAVPLAMNLVAPGHEKYNFDPNKCLWDEKRSDINALEGAIGKALHMHPAKLQHSVVRAMWRDAMADQYKRLLNRTSGQ